ncbi:undecaprenyl-diphosphate phosphatase [Haladaptatus sp. CMAA 1911]|uniref:undecaprenyl-diphosphate phosphatase n=1 Tax=unclassified Haladaptatus TaxID=2622732 RepID=UPI0037549485
MSRSFLIGLILGILQGIFEWLPISSEGNITLVFAFFNLASPTEAVAYALFLHLGTAVSATAYYRDELVNVLGTLPDWRPQSAFSDETTTLSFLGVASLASGIVGIIAYLGLEHVISAVTGGTFVALIGLLLVCTGFLQRFAGGLSLGTRDEPNLVDAVLVGSLQGLAILPGVSRSGTTASALLLRGHDGPNSFRLSFLLSIPAALGGALIAVLDSGGIPSLSPLAAFVSIVTAAVVGYITIDGLMRLVERVSFWAVCVGLGLLAIIGGVLLTV